MTEQEIEELESLIKNEIWVPLPGPQTAAYYSEADEMFYGGSAGGGKSDLLLGLCLTSHTKSIIYRREATQLQGIYDRLFNEILGSRKGFSGQSKIWNGRNRQIEFGACKDVGDEQKYQGRPHDLAGFDEITHFAQIQYKFLSGWLRTTKEGQRCRIVATGNPPTNSDGEWVIDHWAAWLSNKHPNPAMPGELRYYVMVDGVEYEVDDGEDITLDDGEIVTPKSRTFIPSSVEDNPFLTNTGYKATLQALPEPLRSQMLKGDFLAGLGDDPWQAIPTSWVDAAMERWTPDGREGPQDSVGVDVARGGIDETTICTRYGNWFSPIDAYPGSATPNGPAVVSLVIPKVRDKAPIHADVIGVGSSVVDHLDGIGVHVIAVNNAEGTKELDRTNLLRFKNVRAMDIWRMREALDPDTGDNLALPNDPKLKADLCAPRFKLTAQGIQIESKDEVKKRIGRSTNHGDCVVMANRKTPKKTSSVRMPGSSRKGGKVL